MKENTKERSLVRVNGNSIFYKIKSFFKNLLNKNRIDNYVVVEEINSSDKNEHTRSFFMKSIQDIEDEETKLLKLQKRYRSGEIKEQELTKEQVNSLCVLYDKQIERLKRSNEKRKQKLLEHRKKLQTNTQILKN